MRAILWPCFAVSGAAALALEVLWMRSAGLVLGQTPGTTATVLACYFGGMGLGSIAARGIRRHAVRWYGGLEIGVGAGAAWSFAAFRLLSGDGAQGLLAWSGAAGRIAAVAIALLPATLCLGATLPALGQALAPPGSVGRRGGLLYALNTLGGVLGIAAAGFGLPAAIGVRGSYLAAAAASALTGVVALTAGRRMEAEPAPAALPDSTGVTAPSRLRLRLVAAGAGALGLGLEVLWTRLFAQVLHNSVYSFSSIVIVFLLAIAAGAAISALASRRLPPASVATAALLAAAVSSVAGVWCFVFATDGLSYVGMRSGLGEYLLRILALAAVTAGPAAFASGLVLPSLWRAWGENEHAARPLGDLTAANTFGGIAGALGAGFLAVPFLGVRGSLLAAAAGYIVLADAMAPRGGRWRPVGYVVLLAVVVAANPLGVPLIHLRSDVETLRGIREGPQGIVSVVETEGDLQLRLDNYYVLGGSAAAAGERRLGLVPVLLHPAPHRVAFIGLATGITASAAPALGVEETTVVELVPEVAEAAGARFSKWNGGLLGRPGVRLVIDDGRRHLAASREEFDVIVSDLFIPWHAGTGSLYSLEMYETVARRLAPGGLFCQWLPLYQLTREEFDIIARTILRAFPLVSLWRADFYPDRPVLGLVGQIAPRPVDLERVRERVGRLPDWARDPLLAAPRGFAMLHAGNLTAAADLLGTGMVNTDDRPLIEFQAPRLTRIGTAGDKDWFTGESLSSFYDALDRHEADSGDPLLPATAAVLDARKAGTSLFRYALAKTRGDDRSAASLEAEVRALVPEVVSSSDAMGPAATATEASRKLLDLEAEQEALRRRLETMQRRLDEMNKGKDKR